MKSFWGHKKWHLVLSLNLAVGIGASATLLDVFDQYHFRSPREIQGPEEVFGIPALGTYSEFVRHRPAIQTLDVAAYRRNRVTGLVMGATRALDLECVTNNYFDLLGVPTTSGRLPRTSDPAGTVAFAVLSQPDSGASVRLLPSTSSTVTLLDQVLPVGGTVPRGFTGVRLTRPDAWLSIDAFPELCTSHGSLETAGVYAIGRLMPGVTAVQAAAELRAILNLTANQPTIEPLQSSWRHLITLDLRTTTWANVAACLLLLVSMTNVAAFVTIRSVRREAEIAVRRQLGASGVRLIRLFLLEQIPTLILTGLLALCSVILAKKLLLGAMPVEGDVSVVGGRTLTIIAIVTTVATAMAVLIPIWRSTRIPALRALRGNEVTLTSSAFPFYAVVATQSMLAFLLVAGAGLMVRSVRTLWNDAGYAIDQVVLATPPSEDALLPPSRRHQRLQELADVARSVPSVVGVAWTTGDILRSGQSDVFVGVHGDPQSGGPVMALIEAVDPEYFRTIGIQTALGRTFDGSDTDTSQPVVIVDQALAEKLWQFSPAVGRCLKVHNGSACATVVGVTSTQRRMFLSHSVPQVFVPMSQRRYHRSAGEPARMAIRLDGNAELRMTEIQQRFSHDTATTSVVLTPLSVLAREQSRSWRFGARVFGGLGLCAIVTAAQGLCVLLLFVVQARRREIGVRMALGASRGDVVTVVCYPVLAAVGVGLAGGLTAIALLSGVLRSLVFGVQPWDLWSLTLAAASLVVGAIVGVLIPAVRSAAINPSVALRGI